MRKSALSFVAASMLVLGSGYASAQVQQQTTTTWTDQQGNIIREYSTTQRYNSINDPAINPRVGTVLPDTVTVYPLPPTIVVPEPDRYRYGIINNNPVIVERTDRRVIHTWP
jgi:hypothetical protein